MASKVETGSCDECVVVESMDSPNHDVGRAHSSRRNRCGLALMAKGGRLSTEAAFPQHPKPSGLSISSKISTGSSDEYLHPGSNGENDK